MNSTDIIKLLYSHCEKHPIAIEEKHSFLNTYCDADFVAVTSSGQVYEFEIKVSRADFLRDFKKRRHAIYTDERPGQKPNRFWYVAPPGVVDENLPEWAGLIEVTEDGLVEKKKAPLLWRGTVPLRSILQCANAMKHRIAYRYATAQEAAQEP